MNKAVVLKNSECITPLGFRDESVSELLKGRCGIIKGPFFDVPASCAPVREKQYNTLEESSQYLVKSLDTSTIDFSKTILIYCSAKGELSFLENWINKKAIPPKASLPLLDNQLSMVKKHFKDEFGKSIAISNACASGTIAVETAHEFLLEGLFDQAVIIGFEPLCSFVVSGFFSLGALSSEGARPFDAQRDGLSPGECAAAVLLTYEEPQQGDIVIAGAGSSNDANHRTGPSRTGEGLFRASKAACNNAQLNPSDIGAVKCHGTGTLYNDAMEAKALTSLFGKNIPPSISLKGSIGHGSGAGSLNEIVLAAQFLTKRTLPPTVGYNIHGVDEPIPLSDNIQTFERPSILCLSAGFGGVNGAVILKEQQ